MLQTIKRLLYIIPASKISLAGMVLLFIFSSGLEVIGIGAIAPFISLATKPQLLYDYSVLNSFYNLSGINDESRFIAFLGLLVILLFCAKIFVAWLTQVIIFRFSCRQQTLLINRLVDKYISAPYIYHLNKNSSYIIDSVIELANKFIFIVQPLFVAVANTFIAISLFILLWHTSSEVMIVLLVVLLPVLLILDSFKRKIKKWGEQTRVSKGQLIKTINHSLGGIKETKVIGCKDYFQKQVEQSTELLESAQGKFFGFKIFPRYLMEGVMLISTIGAISYFMFVGNSFNDLQSVLGVYAIASLRFIPAFSQLISGINSIRNQSYTIDQIYFDLKELGKDSVANKYSFSSTKNNLSLPHKLKFQNGIRIDNLSYRYSNQVECATKNLSLRINKGDSVAFIGKSGAGKTTLVDVILGLLVPQQGDIRVDGVSIYDNLSSWQQLVGYIPQSIFLADDSLKRNIAFGVADKEIDFHRLNRAIETAQLTQVVANLPQGIDTNLGERGVLLSGGQRQRVGIARALYHEREILILDEATAALDNETEKLVTESINSLSGKKTLITIAHRLTTVEKCDRIFVLEGGRVVKAGKYQEVVV